MAAMTRYAAAAALLLTSASLANAQSPINSFLPTTSPKATWGLFLSGLPTYPPLPTPFPGFWPWFPAETTTIPYPRPGVQLNPTRVQLPATPYGIPFPVERLGGLEFIDPLGGRAFSGGGSFGFPFSSDLNALFPGDDLVSELRRAAAARRHEHADPHLPTRTHRRGQLAARQVGGASTRTTEQEGHRHGPAPPVSEREGERSCGRESQPSVSQS